MNNVPVLKDEKECTGCGACIASCPKQAIRKKRIGLGAWVPEIDITVCEKCGICADICDRQIKAEEVTKKAYVAYNTDVLTRKASASGGVFSALATYVLNCGGSVFGAEISIANGKALVEQSMITQINELPRILGSKYVQSDCVNAYLQVKQELSAGKMVLFSGCSCQIAGIRKYLGLTEQSNLYTVDLICHGVPGIDFLNDYMAFLERKYKGEILKLSFRTKEHGEIKYNFNLLLRENNGYVKEINIPVRESWYYRMFMCAQSYREACYYCKYASLEKPADITVGDYFELADDYPELICGENAIDLEYGISCIITHTEKGQNLIKAANDYLLLKEVDPLVVQASHGNLRRPSSYSKERQWLLSLYKKFGYRAIECYYHTRDVVLAPARAVRTGIHWIIRK